MNRLTKKLRSCVRRGCYPYKNDNGWDVYIESEGLLGPRGLNLTKREAVILAYQISVSKKHKLIVTYGVKDE